MSLIKNKIAIRLGTTALLLLLTSQTILAATLRDRIIERRQQQQTKQASEDNMAESGPAKLPADIQIVRDVSYGNDERQRFDVYSPKGGKDLPVIFMVHGGGWSVGDKAAQSVIENKVTRWVPKGFIFISTNYRMLPKAPPLEQATDIARAVAAAQGKAADWGGDKNKFILMGHSAGAHLVALLASAPPISAKFGALPWLGTVSLDSAALDVVQIMGRQHAPLYDRAFGQNAASWKSASPFHLLQNAGAPFLAVCSTQRDDSCAPAARFVAKANSLGMKASVLEKNMSHKEINQRLGEEREYTEAVEAFMRALDPSMAAALAK